MQSLVQARWKRARAIELAVQGHSFDEIARQVGFSHRGSAHRAVYKALADREVAGVEDFRQLELDRLDALQRAAWDQAMHGDLQAVQVVLRIIDQRTRLLGLPDRGGGGDQHARYLVRPPEGNPEAATA